VRVARFGALAVLLALVALAGIALAVWASLGRGRHSTEGSLPLEVSPATPGVLLLVAVAASVAAAFVALAALEAASAMQVLARDRRPPPPLPRAVRRTRRLVLGPPAEVALRPVDVPALPPSTLALQPLPGQQATVRCTVLVPAHNEELILGETLASLRRQRRTPDRIIVVADNCTDATAQVARGAGAEVIETVGNTEKKAGALNQVLHDLLPSADRDDVFLVMDADSTISEEYLEVGLGLLEVDDTLMAVGGLFYGEEGGGLVGQLQRNEYTRYQRLVSRSRGRVFVLTGTASLFRAFAYQAVADLRGTLLPGPPGRVYDTLALTEDNELTVALKTLGARMVSPLECRVVTEVMTTWSDLRRQRLRWHRGALENIGAYGLTRATAIYWFQQLALGYGVIALNSCFLLLLVTLLAADSFAFSLFWTVVGLIFVVERVVTVWAVGRRGRLLAAPIVIELAYVLVLQVVFVTSLLQIATGRSAGWNYVPRQATT
jgi:cellulose synthase/poly-beta-1,6-N-acetylglucosamine synthase-like glycosyltransferase